MSLFNFFKKRKPEAPADRPPVQQERVNNPVAWIRVEMPDEKLVKQMKEPKDVRVVVSSTGVVEATCKACGEQIKPAAQDGFLWLVCAHCSGISFLTMANLPRDMRLAEEAGGVFEFELFFLRNLPPGFSPPKLSQALPAQATFIFTVELVYGTKTAVDQVALVGAINLGTVKIGDSLVVLCQGGNVKVELEDIVTTDRGKLQQAGKGQEVALVLRGIRAEQPKPGDCVVARS